MDLLPMPIGLIRTWYSLIPTDFTTMRLKAASYMQVVGDIHALIVAVIFTVAF